MMRKLRCSRGHVWEAEVLPPAMGETTRVLPSCPVCGEVGQPDQPLLQAKIENAPTSRLDQQDSEIETSAAPIMPEQPLPAIPGYELLNEIGRGGMGIVYRAMDIRRQCIVAVKLLPRLDPAALLRFKQEFRALADLHHPNLASVYELGTSNGFFFLVLEHVTGATFTDHFLAITDPAERWVRLKRAVGQLLEGMQYLHENALVHCDIKPGNVLVTPEGRVVLLDFGLVTALDLRDRASSELVGSIGYIAPERYQGGPATPAGDYYALGVMLFEILTGRRPFAGERTQLIWQHQYFDPPQPREFVRDLPQIWNDLCYALLQRDPALRPDAAAIARQLALGPVRTQDAGVIREPPFFGRDMHLAVLRSAFEESLRGRAVLVRLTGGSGMGKTTLIERFLQRTQRAEPAWVFRGRCYEHESVPYKGLDGLVDSVAQALTSIADDDLESLLPEQMTALARAFPVLRRVRLVGRGWKTSDISNPVEMRHRVVHVLTELTGRFAAQRPVIAVIEDFQWSDLDSANLLLEFLANPPPVLLIVSSRLEDGAAPCLRYLSERLPAVSQKLVVFQLSVDLLTAMESASLAQALLADLVQLGDDWSSRIAEESRGWPVHVHEICRFVRQATDNDSLPPAASDLSLRRVIEDRLRCRSASERRLLEVLAWAGQPISIDTALAAAQLPATDRTLLAPLRRDHWIRSESTNSHHRIECAHATISDAIRAIIPDHQAADIHERLARAYSATPDSEPELVAAHLLAAGRGSEAADLYERAAQRAEDKLAFDRAAFLLRMTLDLKEFEPAIRDALLLRLAQALVNAGRGSEAAAVFLSAAAGADRARALQLRRLAAYHFCTSGQMDQGLALLRDVLSTAGIPNPGSPERFRAALTWERLRQRWRRPRFEQRPLDRISPEDLERVDLCWSATAGTSLFDVVAGAYYQCLHFRYAFALGDPTRLARALIWEAGHLSTDGSRNAARADQVLAEARSLIKQHEQPHLRALADMVDGIIAHNRGEWSAARERLLRAEELLRSRCFGVGWERSTANAFLFWTLFQLGAFDESKSLVERLMREAREHGDRFSETNFGTFALPLSLVVAGKATEAREVLRKHRADWTHPGFHLQHLTALWSECRIDLYERRAADGLQRLLDAWPEMKRAELFQVQTIRITVYTLRATLLGACLLAKGDPNLFRDLRSCIRILRQEHVPWAAAHALTGQAAMACLHGDVSAARDELSKAIAHFEKLGMAAHAAAGHWWLGKLLGPAEGRSLVSHGEGWLQSAGAADPESFCRMQIGAILPG